MIDSRWFPSSVSSYPYNPKAYAGWEVKDRDNVHKLSTTEDQQERFDTFGISMMDVATEAKNEPIAFDAALKKTVPEEGSSLISVKGKGGAIESPLIVLEGTDGILIARAAGEVESTKTFYSSDPTGISNQPRFGGDNGNGIVAGKMGSFDMAEEDIYWVMTPTEGPKFKSKLLRGSTTTTTYSGRGN